MNTPEWDDTWAVARAASDQDLAAIRDEEDAVRRFMGACIEFDEHLRRAGVDDKQRISTVVNLALGTAIT